MRADTEYLTAQELARRWRCSPWSICQWAKAGRISGAAKCGRHWRFPLDAQLRSSDEPSVEPGGADLNQLFARLQRRLG